jgi:FkbM family methyltransferase
MSRDAWIPTGPGDAPLATLDLDGGAASINQRQLRRVGLAGWQAQTTAGLLAAWDLTGTPGTFLDIGANAGIYSLLCRRLWPEMAVVAFEPSPSTLDAGRRWARANALDVRFEPVALSDRDDRGTLYLSQRSDASNSLEEGFRAASGSVEVELCTLDTWVVRAGVVPTVVKIDVEQHEPAVIAGAHDTLAAHRPVIVMELLGTPASAQAHQRLTDLGYVTHDLGERDRLYWPDALPAGWMETYREWRRAVARCQPSADRGRPGLGDRARRLVRGGGSDR